MLPYIDDVVAFAEREIQRYQASGKDYRVGVIKSQYEFMHGHQEIEYWPLSERLDKALEALDSIQYHQLWAPDIQLNAIEYALERCAFRPDAQRKLIVFGNDIPMCGGNSPLSIIGRCQKLGVVLEIHGADGQIGPLLALRTGGKWFPAFDNPHDTELLESINVQSPQWKLQITLDDVIERTLSGPQ